MSRQRIMSRLITLEAHGTAGIPRGLLAALAERYELDAGELWAEAERLVTRFAEYGATTWADQLHLVASEQGITVEELQAEVDAVLAVCQ
jgi:hypothetical protein